MPGVGIVNPGMGTDAAGAAAWSSVPEEPRPGRVALMGANADAESIDGIGTPIAGGRADPRDVGVCAAADSAAIFSVETVGTGMACMGAAGGLA